VHDPASTFQPFTPWPDSEDVVVRYVPPAAVMSIEWLAVITSHDLYPMS
jgi:NADPH-dependent 7-cyano-7-deazaguanine reductase QueF